MRILAKMAFSSIFLFGLFQSADARATDPDPDPWMGRDKALHFGVSAGLAGVGYAALTTQFDSRSPPLLISGGATLAIGAAKEGADALGLGTPSWKDFAWDAIGTVIGLGVAWGIDLLLRGVDREHPLFGTGSPTKTNALHF